MESIPKPYSTRNAAIDMLRALTMFTMIFVNDFWKVHDIPSWMDHAKYGEDFMGLADFVYPTFMFVVGMSIPYAIERRYVKGYSEKSTMGHILTRTLALLIMGAFITNSEARLAPDFSLYRIGVYWFIMAAGFIGIWNMYPSNPSKGQKRLFTSFKIIGAALLVFLAITFRSPRGVFTASWGILGSIGWTYLFCAIAYFFCRDNLKKLSGVWLFLLFVLITSTPLREGFGGKPILDLPQPNFYDSFLRLLHIGNGAMPFLATSGMILSVLTEKNKEKSGVWELSACLIGSVVLLMLGLLTHRFWIAAKLGATPPWVFFVMAIAVALYGFLAMLERHSLTGWFKLIKPAGTATLTAYLVPYVFYGFADVTGVVLPDWFTHGWASIVNCLCFAFVVILVTGILEKLHIKLKI